MLMSGLRGRFDIPRDKDREFILLSNKTRIEVKVEMNISRAAQDFRLLFTGAGEYEFKGDLLCFFI